MGQEEYGSYAREKPGKFSIRKFIKYVVLITLLLAVVEVVIIYFVSANDKEHQKVMLKDSSNKLIPVVADSNKPFTDTTPVPKPYQSPFDTLSNSIASGDSTRKDSAAGTIKFLLRNLSLSDMSGIAKRITNLNAKSHLNSNCIQIRKTSTSNVANAFKLAEFLKKQGFVINGRLVVSGTQKGVSISHSNECTIVTVGSM